MRVERDAVTPNSRPRIKGHKAKRLRGGRTNDLPGVDPERVTELGHFIGHPDVDRTKGVLPKLACLGDTCGGHRMHILHDLRVQETSSLARVLANSANDLWNVVRLKLRIAWIHSLGRERQQKVLVQLESLLLKHR